MKYFFLLIFFFGIHPAALASKSIVPAHFSEFTSDGVEIMVFPVAKVPIFDVELVFQGGANSDFPGKTGTANLMASLLNRGLSGGSLSRSEGESLRLLDRFAGGISYSVDVDEFVVTAYGLSSEYERIIDFAFDGLEGAAFEKSVLERFRKNLMDATLQIADSPASLATYAADLIATNGTTYARPITGGWSSLPNITVNDLRSARDRLVRKDRLKILLLAGSEKGDPLLAGILQHLKKRVERLPCANCKTRVEKPRAHSWPVFDVRAGSIVVVEKKGFAESHVRLVAPGPPRTSEDFYPLLIAENVLGGTFGSRLVSVLREKHGLTYSVDVSFEFGREFGVLKIATSTRNERLFELLDILNAEMSRFYEGGISNHELKKAKEYLVGSFPLGLQNSFLVAERFFRGLLEGLPATYLDEYSTKIDSMSVSEVNTAIKKYFHPKNFKTIVSCDVEAFKRQNALKKKKHVVLSAKQVVESY